MQFRASSMWPSQQEVIFSVSPCREALNGSVVGEFQEKNTSFVLQFAGLQLCNRKGGLPAKSPQRGPRRLLQRHRQLLLWQFPQRFEPRLGRIAYRHFPTAAAPFSPAG